MPNFKTSKYLSGKSQWEGEMLNWKITEEGEHRPQNELESEHMQEIEIHNGWVALCQSVPDLTLAISLALSDDIKGVYHHSYLQSLYF